VVAGRSLENETDSLILRASSRDGKVYDEVVLNLPKSTVGINDDVKQTIFKLYPNPAHDIIILEMNVDDTVRIFNINGAKVLEKNLSSGRHEISINHFSPGIYAVQVNGKSESLVIKE
jgi:hypothetical protein